MVSKANQKNKNASNIINLLKQLINDSSKKSKKNVNNKNKNKSKPANKKIKSLPTTSDEPAFTERRWGTPGWYSFKQLL